MKLVLLRCPNCSEPLRPDDDAVVYACTNCGTPVQIDQDGLRKLEIRCASQDVQPGEGELWLPFWVFQGKVQIRSRETQGGGGSSGRDSQQLWGSPRRLYVPAWALSVNMAQEVGSKLIQRQPEMHFLERPAAFQMRQATVSPADALKLLEFIVLAIEARRKDWLRSLDFNLDVGEPELWAIPKSSAGISR